MHYLISEKEIERYIARSNSELSAPKSPPDMLRTGEVARLTGFSIETVRKLAYSGRLPYIKGNGPRGHLRFPRPAVDQLMAGRPIVVNPPPEEKIANEPMQEPDPPALVDPTGRVLSTDFYGV